MMAALSILAGMSGKKISLPTWIGIGLVLILAFMALKPSHPSRRFVSATYAISRNPETWLGERYSISTYPADQPLFGPSVTSKDIEKQIMDAYNVLQGRLLVKSATYYSPCGDMATQETIWQYPSCFVRLYVTSALECDGAEVAVHPGSYQEFRGERLSPDCDETIRFVEIPFESPARFLADR